MRKLIKKISILSSGIAIIGVGAGVISSVSTQRTKSIQKTYNENQLLKNPKYGENYNNLTGVISYFWGECFFFASDDSASIKKDILAGVDVKTAILNHVQGNPLEYEADWIAIGISKIKPAVSAYKVFDYDDGHGIVMDNLFGSQTWWYHKQENWHV